MNKPPLPRHSDPYPGRNMFLYRPLFIVRGFAIFTGGAAFSKMGTEPTTDPRPPDYYNRQPTHSPYQYRQMGGTWGPYSGGGVCVRRRECVARYIFTNGNTKRQVNYA